MKLIVQIRKATLPDLEGIRDIYNEAILTTTATFDTEPKSADEVELAAWTQVCRVILNLHETITRY